LVPREDVRATIEARRELGETHEDELVDAFVARIERRLADRPPARRHRSEGNRTSGGIAVAIVSMGVAIPLIAIAGNFGGSIAVVAVCAMVIVLNALYWEQTK
jgi:hypothetical protein